MADDPNKRDKHDRDKVSKQRHEIEYVVKKSGMPKPLVEKIQEQIGPSRHGCSKSWTK